MREADRLAVVPGNAKLPLMRTLWLTSTDYFHYLGDVCRLAGPWILLLAVITGAANAFKWSWAAWIFERFKAGNLQNAGIYPFISMSLYLVILLLMTLACIDVAVAWHRRILLSERPGGRAVASRRTGVGNISPSACCWGVRLFCQRSSSSRLRPQTSTPIFRSSSCHPFGMR
jgi:hypothetical protein